MGGPVSCALPQIASFDRSGHVSTKKAGPRRGPPLTAYYCVCVRPASCYRAILRATRPPPTSNAPAPSASSDAPPVSGSVPPPPPPVAVDVAVAVTVFLAWTVALAVTVFLAWTVFLYWTSAATVAKLLRHTFTVSTLTPTALAMFQALAPAIAAAAALP